MSELTPAERLQFCLSERLGRAPRMARSGDRGDDARLEVVIGGCYGDSWSGHTGQTRVELRGARHPQTGRDLTACLAYEVHDLSGQVDAWDLTLAGFSEAESSAIREELDPHKSVPNRNNHLRYRWVIDGVVGSSAPPERR
jgi:hypothetical protein